MIGDSLPIRAERLIRGDIVLWGGATWQVRLAEPTSLTELEIVLDGYTHGDQDDPSDLRTVVSRDSKFRVLLLA